MANIKSAKKRVLVNKRQKQENRLVKSSLSTEIKKFRKEVESGNLDKAEEMLKSVEADIMSAKSKGMLHDNTASRKVSRLKSLLNNAKSGNTAKEEPVVKTKKAAKVEEPKVEVVEEKKEEVKEEKPAKKTTAKKTTTKAAKETAEPKATKKAAPKKETTKTKETTAKKTTKKA